VAGGICQTPSYLSGKGKTAVQQEFRNQVQVFVENDLDFIICEVRWRNYRKLAGLSVAKAAERFAVIAYRCNDACLILTHVLVFNSSVSRIMVAFEASSNISYLQSPTANITVTSSSSLSASAGCAFQSASGTRCVAVLTNTTRLSTTLRRITLGHASVLLSVITSCAQTLCTASYASSWFMWKSITNNFQSCRTS